MLDSSCSRFVVVVAAALVACACGETEDHPKSANVASTGAGGAGGVAGGGGTAGSGPVIPVSVTLTARNHGQPVDLAFAAFQNGDEPWQLLAGNDGAYTFQVTQGSCASGRNSPSANWTDRLDRERIGRGGSARHAYFIRAKNSSTVSPAALMIARSVPRSSS